MYGNFSSESIEEYARLLSRRDPEFSETYDFTRCVRPNGTAYGTGGKCRKGSEQKAAAEEPKQKGVRIGKTVGALPVQELRKLLKDPRLKPHQVKKVEELIKAKSGKTKSLAERMAAAADELDKKLVAPKKEKAKKVTAAEEKKEKPKPTSREITSERLKKSFDRLMQKSKDLQERKEALKKDGKKWDDPEVKEISRRIGTLDKGATILKQAYHAVDKAAFLRESAAAEKVFAEAERKDKEAAALMERDKISYMNIPKNHPAARLFAEAHEIRWKARGVRERQEAAYYGEPATISKPKSDGGGEVSPSVPSGVPRGGANKDLKEFLNGAEVVMAFNPKGFSGFVKSGEAKNGFQPGTGGLKVGRVRPYLDARMRGEETVLSLPQSTKGEDRPVYAALEHPDRSRSLQGGAGMMSQYGGIQVIFNPSVKDRSTFTIGDSLDDNSPRSIPASPVRDPAKPVRSKGKDLTVNVDYGGGVTSARMRTNVPALDVPEDRKKGIPYVETQIFGGLKTSDIREVRIYKGHEIPSSTKKALEKMGVKIVELPPRLRDLVVSQYEPDSQQIDSIFIEK